MDNVDIMQRYKLTVREAYIIKLIVSNKSYSLLDSD